MTFERAKGFVTGLKASLLLLLGGAWLSMLLSCAKADAQQEPLATVPKAADVSIAEKEAQTLVPDFRFTKENFARFARQYLPEAAQAKVLAQPQIFLQLLQQLLEQDRTEPMLSRLVDKQHALSESYAPDDLVPLNQYAELHLTRGGLQLRRLLIADLLAMNRAAAGVTLLIGSAYRSFAYQRDVFRRYSQRAGIEVANRYSARAGESQHQLGLVIDFAPISQEFARMAASKWLQAHALEYGFSLSYPEGQEEHTGYIYEPWHFRYVGPAIARLLSEYFDQSQQDFFLFWKAAATEANEYYKGHL